MQKFTRFLTCLLGLSLLFSSRLAGAQSGFTASLSQPRTEGFPILTTYLDVRGTDGAFLSGLKPDQVTLQEDGRTIAVDSLEETRRPVDFLVAINAGRELGLRDSNGTTRYDLIVQALDAWADAAPVDLPRNYGLVVNNAPDQTGISSAAAWKTGFDAYKPDMRAAKPSSDALGRALDIAASTSQTADPPTEKVVLYITPAPESSDLSTLPGLLDRAKQGNIHVLVWMVASASAFDLPAAQQLSQMAQETGGQFTGFSGAEGLPDLETYLTPLHPIYVLKYHSAIHSGTASHELSAQIQVDPATTASAGPVKYDLVVLPPNPMLVSPPAQVTRTSPKDSETPLEDLTPLTYPLQTLVEFPDGLPRPLVSLRLYVDGKMVSEKTAPIETGGSSGSSERFDWDLSGYQASGRHTLRVEVVDSLGMSKSSLETPVEVKVNLPQVSLWDRLARSNLPASVGAVLLAGLSLGFVVVLANRRRAHLAVKKGMRPRTAAAPAPTAPLIPRPDGRAGSWPEKLRWPHHNPHAPIEASLLRLNPNLQPMTGAPLPIQGKEVTFGHDPTLATCMIEDASVDGMHARLRQEADGCYLLSDHGSIAGTWVNFTPVREEGVRLEHGDIIHIGRCAFRFQLTRPVHVRKPVVQPYNDSL